MNYEDYPQKLDRSMKANLAGLTRYLLVDDRGFGNMVRQCLNRRIDCMQNFAQQVATLQADRSHMEAKVDWQYTTEDARIELERLYPNADY